MTIRKRFGLGEKIGEQRSMVFGVLVRRDDRADEVRRNGLRALMQRLKKTVLGVGARPAP